MYANLIPNLVEVERLFPIDSYFKKAIHSRFEKEKNSSEKTMLKIIKIIYPVDYKFKILPQ